VRGENGRAATTAVAACLDVEAASVTGMLKKLAELRLIEYVPYQGASLTVAGEKIALEVIRHHRLIELYLMEAMGYTWDQVHDEADRLEHAISEEFEDRIAHLLGDPTTDPHGDPIPTKAGHIAATSRDTLNCAASGCSYRVERVRDEDPAVLRRAAELGLRPLALLTVQSAAPHLPLAIILADGTPHLVESTVAAAVFVVPA
jgi:DtxR family Mn-dependent transcriptional regulator